MKSARISSSIFPLNSDFRSLIKSYSITNTKRALESVSHVDYVLKKDQTTTFVTDFYLCAVFPVKLCFISYKELPSVRNLDSSVPLHYLITT